MYYDGSRGKDSSDIEEVASPKIPNSMFLDDGVKIREKEPVGKFSVRSLPELKPSVQQKGI